jgi:hypothetical protein
MVSIPEYPFEEFARDFDSVNTEANALAEREFGDVMAILRSYLLRQYPIEGDRMRRGAALWACFLFVAENISGLDAGRIAVHGETASLFPESTFRAVYEVVVGYALDSRRPEPTLREVLRRTAAYKDADLGEQ